MRNGYHTLNVQNNEHDCLEGGVAQCVIIFVCSSHTNKEMVGRMIHKLLDQVNIDKCPCTSPALCTPLSLRVGTPRGLITITMHEIEG
jgi:hypothetical protein